MLLLDKVFIIIITLLRTVISDIVKRTLDDWKSFPTKTANLGSTLVSLAFGEKTAQNEYF